MSEQLSELEYHKLGKKVNEYIQCKHCEKSYSIAETTINIYGTYHSWMKEFCSIICFLSYNEQHKVELIPETLLTRVIKRIKRWKEYLC